MSSSKRTPLGEYSTVRGPQGSASLPQCTSITEFFVVMITVPLEMSLICSTYTVRGQCLYAPGIQNPLMMVVKDFCNGGTLGEYSLEDRGPHTVGVLLLGMPNKLPKYSVPATCKTLAIIHHLFWPLTMCNSGDPQRVCH